MDMKMIDQGLAPSVEDGQDAGPAFQFPLRIGGKDEQGLLDRCKQPGQHPAAVGRYQRVEQVGHGKDHVKVTAGQQLGPTVVQPLLSGQGLALGTVSVAAGVVAVSDRSAVVAGLLVTAKARGPAGRDRGHDLAPVTVHGMGLPILFAMQPEHVCYFMFRFHARPSVFS